MKLLFASAIVAVCVAAAPIVTYTTEGNFTPGTNNPACDATPPLSNCQTTGPSGGTLRFMMGSGSYDLGILNPSNITFGTIESAGIPGILTGTIFTLTVHQTSPSTGSASATGSISGKVLNSASNAFLYFPTPTMTIGAVNYEIFQGPRGIAIVPPSSNPGGAGPGATTIEGQISTTMTPEPATMTLMGLGLLGVGFVARRRNA